MCYVNIRAHVMDVHCGCFADAVTIVYMTSIFFSSLSLQVTNLGSQTRNTSL